MSRAALNTLPGNSLVKLDHDDRTYRITRQSLRHTVLAEQFQRGATVDLVFVVAPSNKQRVTVR